LEVVLARIDCAILGMSRAWRRVVCPAARLGPSRHRDAQAAGLFWNAIPRARRGTDSWKGKEMRKAATSAILAATLALAIPAHAQTAGTTGSDKGTTTGTTGALPQESLAGKRTGAMGDQPAPVQQGGQDGAQAEAEGTTTGKLPPQSLPGARTGAIGDQPAPVTQGGGKTN
jgi:hypothetical protein